MDRNDLTQKIETYKKLIRQIDELEEEKKRIVQEIIENMPSRTFDTPEYKAICYRRLSIQTTLEEARSFGATKMEESVDKEKVKQLFTEGASIKGVEEKSYLTVRKLNTKSSN